MMHNPVPDPTDEYDRFAAWSLLYVESNLTPEAKEAFEDMLRASDFARVAFAEAIQHDTALYEQARLEESESDAQLAEAPEHFAMAPVHAEPAPETEPEALPEPLPLPARRPLNLPSTQRRRGRNAGSSTRLAAQRGRDRSDRVDRNDPPHSVFNQYKIHAAIAASIALILGAWLLMHRQPPVESIATLASSNKDVILHVGNMDVNASAGMEIHLGDILEVPANGSASIRYSDNTLVELNPGAMLTFELSPTGGKQVFLSRGSVAADVAKQPLGKPMIFGTPQAQSTVLGTRLSLVVKDVATRLDVQEGNVRMTRTMDNASVQVQTSQYAVADSRTALIVKNFVTVAQNPTTVSMDPFNYGEALQKAISFYEAQRSGVLPANKRFQWRGDSGTRDGSDNGVDLAGGWYDGGDHVKFGFPMASSVTMLAWSVVEYRDSYASSGQLPQVLENIKWATDYFIKAHTAPDELWAQVGTGSVDHAWWGPPEVMQMPRLSFKIDAQKPGSDLAGETAAALAAASIAFAPTDKAYSAKLLAHAKQLYAFADKCRGRYSDSITDAQGYYNSSSGYWDELVWGAAWLYRATNEPQYLKTAESYYPHIATESHSSVRAYRGTHSWDDKSYGARVLLAGFTHQNQYIEDSERWLDYWTEGYHGQRIPYTPGGLAWLDASGPLRYAENTAFLALVYSDNLPNTHPKKKIYHAFAVSQVNYALGKNPQNRSFMVGFGNNPPQNPHHRSAHGSWVDNIQIPAVNQHVLYGALVGGPGFSDNYSDERTSYISNEVACDYNAGFTGALARLYKEFGGRPLANFPPQELKQDEFFSEAQVNASAANFTELRIQINNRTSCPPKVSTDLVARYFVNLSEVFAAGYTLSDVRVTMNFSQGALVSEVQPWDAANGIYYVDISFAGIPVFPGGLSVFRKEAQLRLALPGIAATTTQSKIKAWDPSNDWSFAGLGGGTAPVRTHNIPIYESGKKLFGNEPPGGPGSR